MIQVAALLAFEAKWGAHTGHKEEAIRRELGVTPARYYQLLGRAIRHPRSARDGSAPGAPAAGCARTESSAALYARRVKKLGGAALIAALIVSLSACAGAGPAPAITSSEPTPTAEATGTTLDELQAAYVAAGGQCDSITPRTTMSVAAEAGDCDGGALLSTYESEGRRDAAIRLLEGLQDTNPSPHQIAVGDDWIVNGADAGSFASAMGGEAKQIGTPAPPAAAQFDLTTDAGLCAADAEMTNLELNDAIAPLLGYPADRDARTADQDNAIRAYKHAAFERECPARAG